MSVYIPFKPFISRLDNLVPRVQAGHVNPFELKVMVKSAKKHIAGASLKLKHLSYTFAQWTNP